MVVVCWLRRHLYTEATTVYYAACQTRMDWQTASDPLSTETVAALIQYGSRDLFRPFCVMSRSNSHLGIVEWNPTTREASLKWLRYQRSTHNVECETRTRYDVSRSALRNVAVNCIMSMDGPLLLSPSSYYSLLIADDPARPLYGGRRRGEHHGHELHRHNLTLRRTYDYVVRHARWHLVYPIRYLIDELGADADATKTLLCYRGVVTRLALFMSWLLSSTAPLVRVMGLTLRGEAAVREWYYEEAESLLRQLRAVLDHLYTTVGEPP